MTSLSRLALQDRLEAGATVTVAADRGRLVYLVQPPAGPLAQYPEQDSLHTWADDDGADDGATDAYM